jgi:hypothetical protein
MTDRANPTETEQRLAALEAQNAALCEAIATLELAERRFKPIPLNHPANSALRAIVASVDDVQQPFILPRHNTYPGPRETRLSELGESREETA